MSQFLLPHVFKGHNIFIGGVDLRGVVGDIERPKVTMKMEEYRSGGMLGPVSINQGFEKLTAAVTLAGYGVDVLKQMASTIDGTVLRFSGATQKDDETGFKKVSGEMVGRITEADPGSNTQGENGETKFNAELVSYGEYLDGKEVFFIDVMQNIFRVDGVDRYQGFNQSLS